MAAEILPATAITEEFASEPMRGVQTSPCRWLAEGKRHLVTATSATARVLKTRDSGLAGEVLAGLRQGAARQLQKRIGAQEVGIILVLVSAGYLKVALLEEREQRVACLTVAPLRHVGRPMASHKPSFESASANHAIPPSEVRRPPSKVASRASGVRVSKRVFDVAQSPMGEPPRYGWVFEQRNLS
jgi:hypothetical protein